MISKRKCTLIYTNVYRKLLRIEKSHISAIDLDRLIRSVEKDLGKYLRKNEKTYVIGYFKKNKILTPDGYLLKINIKKGGEK